MLPAALRKPLLLALVTAALPGAGLLATGAKLAPPARKLLKQIRQQDVPTVDLPHAWRRKNWAPYGEGSCVHASLVMLLHWQGRHQLADWWEATYHSGETAERLAQRLQAAGVRFAETRTGDVRFLEWALRTGRGCAVTVQNARHMVCLVHLDDRWAGLLDNNAPHQIRWLPRTTFLNQWRSGPIAWAVTPVYAPPPSHPWRPEN